jgi:hypothetical protein
MAAQVDGVGAGFWLFLLLIVLGFGLLVVVWAALRHAFGPRSQWRRDMELQERIRQEKRRLEVDAWEEAGRHVEGGDEPGETGTGDEDRGEADEADRGTDEGTDDEQRG